jgi:hypothetical protein
VSVAFEEGTVEADLLEIATGALRQAMVGAASVPLKAVGGFFRDDGGLDLDPIPAVAGAAGLTPDSTGRIAGLVDLLEGRPTLALTLAGRAGPDDREPLAEQLLAERVAAGGDLPELGDDDAPGFVARRRIRSALGKRAAGEQARLSPEDRAGLERYLEAVEVPGERYDALARARAEGVRAALLATERVDAARIELAGGHDPGAPGVVLSFTALSE